jgi:hypothetical protein
MQAVYVHVTLPRDRTVLFASLSLLAGCYASHEVGPAGTCASNEHLTVEVLPVGCDPGGHECDLAGPSLGDVSSAGDVLSVTVGRAGCTCTYAMHVGAALASQVHGPPYSNHLASALLTRDAAGAVVEARIDTALSTGGAEPVFRTWIYLREGDPVAATVLPTDFTVVPTDTVCGDPGTEEGGSLRLAVTTVPSAPPLVASPGETFADLHHHVPHWILHDARTFRACAACGRRVRDDIAFVVAVDQPW